MSAPPTLTLTWRSDAFGAGEDAFVALRSVPQHTVIHIRLELHAIRTPHSATSPALYTDLPAARRADWTALVPDSASSTPLVAQFVVSCGRAGSFRIFAALADNVNARHSPVIDLVVTAALALPWQPQSQTRRFSARDLALQTFLTKQLGPLCEWRSRILGAINNDDDATAQSRVGVNAFHFTPLESRGQSDSAYSIANQLRYDARLFADNDSLRTASSEVQDEHVRSFLADLRTETHALLFADIVLNHTADNSPWLAEQPDAAYNTRNSPHLRVAYALDCAMVEFSATLERERRNVVRSHGDVEALVGEFFDRVLPARRLADECVDDAQRAALADDLRVARDNMTRRVAYLRLDEGGPRHGDIGVKQPLVESYFTTLAPADGSATIGLAHNGWMWGASGVDDFAAPQSHAYIRRDVIIWSDSIKLRYGARAADSPWLWAHMEQYVRRTARLFDGLRIDNCHNTPMHVAEHFIDVARAERPDIFVVAELFTGSERTDALWSARLGLSALIREAVHPTNSTELAHLCHRFGVERAVGEVTRVALEPGHVSLEPRMPPALFTDCTHDNETPAQRQTAEHSLALLALTLMTHAAAGTVRGFDQFVPRTIDLVRDKRLYAALDVADGLVDVRRRFLDLRRYMAERGGFDEAYVHRTDETIFITRHNIADGEALVLVAHTAFRGNGAQSIGEFDVDGDELELLFGARLARTTDTASANDKEIAGERFRVLPAPALDIARSGPRRHRVRIGAGDTFPPGSVLVFKCTLDARSRETLERICRVASAPTPISNVSSLVELSYLLYSCDQEERHLSGGKRGAYMVPRHGSIPYCGFQGVCGILDRCRAAGGDPGHALFANLRDGDWLMHYLVERLDADSAVRTWLAEHVAGIAALPRNLVPRAFAHLCFAVRDAASARAVALMSPFVRDSRDAFVQQLAHGSLQMHGRCGLMAAGLPHFAAGYMRTWGRDTFIALRGLLLLTGRFDEAREHLLMFASCVRHGLVPNLLDGGNRPRYNARDATWFFLDALRHYTRSAPEGSAVLQRMVTRRFADNDSGGAGDVVPLADVVFDIMQRHAAGIHFREWRAGPEIDAHMTERGFQIDIELHDDGLLYGGNEWNCGTWQDKMGSAPANRGRPATPRDGAPIECSALLYSTLCWLEALPRERFPHTTVQWSLDGGARVTWYTWAERIERNFARVYYVPRDAAADARYQIDDASLVNRRGIWKDVAGPTQRFAAYQLRSNAVVAMSVAPSLFDATDARDFLDLVERELAGPLGMRTLDRSDWAYNGHYDNGDETHGYSYHQGPEWLWLFGHFVRAVAHFGEAAQSSVQLMRHLRRLLDPHRKYLAENADGWFGLPELTNRDGAPCRDSCPTQAWTFGTLIEAMHALQSKQLL
jgi:glycogen debranching enzyme